MNFPDQTSKTHVLLTCGLGVLLSVGYTGGKVAIARSSSSQSQTVRSTEVSIDEYQRSAQIYYMQRMSKSGWERGQEIYLVKCLVCHNDYTIKEEPKGAGPTLRDLYKRPKLLSGQPVNDQTVTAQIREGGGRMPSYRYILSAKDLSDLVSYLREKCCWDENNPPANPRYRAQ
jgi:cbb3-type cytochrome c oxidase subunit III